LDDLVLSANTSTPPNVVRNGLLPFLAMLAIGGSFYALARKRMSASKNEAVQAVFTLVMVSFVTLTVIGIWFRGAGMQLMWAG